MKNNKREIDSEPNAYIPKGTLTRKQRKRANRKLKKISNAVKYAEKHNTNKICINSNHVKDLKQLITGKEAEIFSKLDSKILSNDKNQLLKPNLGKKKKKKRKKNKNSHKTENVKSENIPEEDCSSSFKTSANNSARLARLQEFVNQESNKMKSEPKKDNNSMNSSDSNRIKDKHKLNDLRMGKKADEIEFNKLGRASKLNAYEKKNIFSHCEEDFECLLNDIESGLFNAENSKEYTDIYSYNSDTELQNDMLISLGKMDPSKSQKKASKESTNEPSIECFNSDDDSFENVEEFSDENEIKESNFLDDEAEEDEMEESEGESDENEKDVMFESGSVLNGQFSTASSVTINSIFDHHLSDSEEEDEEDSDLDGFIVDDQFVEYDDEERLSPDKGKSKNIKKNSRILNRQFLMSDDEMEECKDLQNFPIKKNARKRISSESSDIEDLSNSVVQRSKRKRILSEDSEIEEIKSSGDNKENDITSENILKPSLKNKKENNVNGEHLVNGKDSSILNKKRKEINGEMNGLNASSYKEDKENEHIENMCEESSSIPKQGKGKKGKLTKSVESNSPALIKDKCEVEENPNLEDLSDSVNCETKSILKLNGRKSSADNGKKRVSFPEDLNTSSDENKPNNQQYYEDIYGRLKDKDGNLVNLNVANESDSKNPSKYIPPAMRKLMALNNDAKKKEQLQALKKRLKGLFNRLAESNMAGILNQIESFYQTNSRNDMNDTLTKLLFEVILSPVLQPEKLVQEHAMFIALLSANVGNEVGAHILSEFVLKWVEDLDNFSSTSNANQVDSKELDNMLHFICQLYNFKIVDSTLIYDMLDKILERTLSHKEVDLILIVLKNVGFTLRKDNPLALKGLITKINSKADEMSSKLENTAFTRIKFMLEILIMIKNNNMSKVPNYDPSHIQYLKTLMKGLIKKGCRTPDLKMSLGDITKSKTLGKWWIVGSAWSGGLKEEMQPTPLTQRNGELSSSFACETFEDNFKEKAAKLHLSRAPRINIFYALTDGADNYLDSVEKLIGLKLDKRDEKETFNVILYCCMRHKGYSDYYERVTVNLCSRKKEAPHLLQKSIWDQFEELETMKKKHFSNLAKFVGHLIAENTLNLSIYKNLKFSEASEATVSFLRQSLISLFLYKTGNYAVTKAFNTLCSAPKLKVLRQYLKAFISKFVNPKESNDMDTKILISRVKLAMDILDNSGGVKL